MKEQDDANVNLFQNAFQARRISGGHLFHTFTKIQIQCPKNITQFSMKIENCIKYGTYVSHHIT